MHSFRDIIYNSLSPPSLMRYFLYFHTYNKSITDVKKILIIVKKILQL